MRRVSTKTNAKPSKVYIKDSINWRGKSVGLVLSRNNALILAEGLIRASQKSDKIDVTIFTKAKIPTVTVTYLS